MLPELSLMHKWNKTADSISIEWEGEKTLDRHMDVDSQRLIE